MFDGIKNGIRLFTTVIPHSVGFTDQLMQLSILYRIGIACGLQFRLTPLVSTRSPEGFWSHFNLEQYFMRLSAEDSAQPTQRVDLSCGAMKRAGVSCGTDLVAFVKSQIREESCLIEFGIQDNRLMLSKLVLTGDDIFRCDLDEIISKVFTPNKPWSSQDALKVVSHIRCGDAADVPVLPNAGYLAWHQHITPTVEGRLNPFISARITLETLRRALAFRPIECNWFTDGYERTRKLTQAASSRGGLLTPNEGLLIHTAIDVNEQVARLLISGDGMKQHFGESLEFLIQLIYHAQQADLILLTGNQRMIPKLLAALGERDQRPAIGLLESSSDHIRYVRAAGLTERHAILVPLSSYGNALSPLLAYFQHGPHALGVPGIERIVSAHGAGLYCIHEVERVAEVLEAQGNFHEATLVFTWLAELTEGSPESHAGLARCARAEGNETAAKTANTQLLEATSKAHELCARQVHSLIALGRLDSASEAIAEGEYRFGEWPALAELKNRLRNIASVSSEPWSGSVQPTLTKKD